MPILLHNWRAIDGYYVVNHAVGEEKYVRAAVLGINDLQGHLSFYPNSIIQDHLGRIFLWASAIAIGCGLATLLLGRSLREEPATRRDETFLLQIIFLVGTILGPLVVLTADISKSAVVGGIVGVPVAPARCRRCGGHRTQAKSTRATFGSQTFGCVRGRGFRIGTV